MNPDDIRDLLRAQPFVPFRMRLNSGAFHDVPHPEMAIVTDDVVALSVYDDAKEKTRLHLVALINIEEIQTLQAMA